MAGPATGPPSARFALPSAGSVRGPPATSYRLARLPPTPVPLPPVHVAAGVSETWPAVRWRGCGEDAAGRNAPSVGPGATRPGAAINCAARGRYGGAARAPPDSLQRPEPVRLRALRATTVRCGQPGGNVGDLESGGRRNEQAGTAPGQSARPPPADGSVAVTAPCASGRPPTVRAYLAYGVAARHRKAWSSLSPAATFRAPPAPGYRPTRPWRAPPRRPNRHSWCFAFVRDACQTQCIGHGTDHQIRHALPGPLPDRRSGGFPRLGEGRPLPAEPPGGRGPQPVGGSRENAPGQPPRALQPPAPHPVARPWPPRPLRPGPVPPPAAHPAAARERAPAPRHVPPYGRRIRRWRTLPVFPPDGAAPGSPADASATSCRSAAPSVSRSRSAPHRMGPSRRSTRAVRLLARVAGAKDWKCRQFDGFRRPP